jgi:hypothetical protein
MDGTGDGFQGVGERGIAVTAPVGLFATSHAQMEPRSMRRAMRASALVETSWARALVSNPFISLRKSLEEQMGQGELQHGVTEEFETLVVGLGALRLIADAAVRERELEQRGIAKGVPENGFQLVHVWRLSKPRNTGALVKSGVTDGIRTRNNQNHNLGLYR